MRDNHVIKWRQVKIFTCLRVLRAQALIQAVKTDGVLKHSQQYGDETMGKRYAMVIDLRKCVGCHACTVACKSENNVPLGVNRSWVEELETGKFPNVSRHRLPCLCNHCKNPSCLKVCPVKATYQLEDGTVLVDYKRCIRCKYCIAACPYDARFINPSEIRLKNVPTATIVSKWAFYRLVLTRALGALVFLGT